MSLDGCPDQAIRLDAKFAGSRKGGASFSIRQRLARMVFGFCWFLLARWTPPQMRKWRRYLLRCFGAQLAQGANVYSSAVIWYPPFLEMGEFATLGPRVRCYNQAPIRLGEFAIVSQDSSLCAGTHNYRDPNFQLTTRPIVIEAHAWVAAEAFVGPGVVIGKQAILGARGVAMKSIPPGEVHAGNPAHFLRMRFTEVHESCSNC
jgi:putative colanic acid biosynthesis acetyltransferase WcaF